MKHNLYIVHFKNGDPLPIYANNVIEAEILAKAEKIKQGLSYEVTHTEEVDNELA